MRKLISSGILIIFVCSLLRPSSAFAFSMGTDTTMQSAPAPTEQPAVPADKPEAQPAPAPAAPVLLNNTPNGFFSNALTPAAPEVNKEGEKKQELPVAPPPRPIEPISADQLGIELLEKVEPGATVEITYLNSAGNTVTVSGVVASVTGYLDDGFKEETSDLKDATAFIISFKPPEGQQSVNFPITSNMQIVSVNQTAPPPAEEPPATLIPGVIGLFGGLLPKHEPLRAILLNGYRMTEGDAFFLSDLKYFQGTYANQAVITVTGLPPGLRFENGAIIGQLAPNSAGTYEIKITATAPNGETATAVIPMIVAAPSNFLSAAQHQITGNINNQDNELHLAYLTLQAQGGIPIDIQNHFSAGMSANSSLPYFSYYFNCDFLSTATMLAAAGSDFVVYEFSWAIVNLQGVTIHHEINLVWLGRTADGKHDIYGFWEPRHGVFVSTFIMNASDQAPTSVPAYAFHNYIAQSNFAQPGTYQIHPTIPQLIHTTPSMHPANYEYHHPLVWIALTYYALNSEMAAHILSGVPSIQPYNTTPAGVAKPPVVPKLIIVNPDEGR